MRAPPAPELCRSRRMARLAPDAMLPESTFRSRARVLFSRRCSGRLAPEEGRLLRKEIRLWTAPVSRMFGDWEPRSRLAVRVCSFRTPSSGEAVLPALEIQPADRFFVRPFFLLGARLVRELVKERWLLKQAPEKV